jgi:hypothetical protein
MHQSKFIMPEFRTDFHVRDVNVTFYMITPKLTQGRDEFRVFVSSFTSFSLFSSSFLFTALFLHDFVVFSIYNNLFCLFASTLKPSSVDLTSVLHEGPTWSPAFSSSSSYPPPPVFLLLLASAARYSVVFFSIICSTRPRSLYAVLFFSFLTLMIHFIP